MNARDAAIESVEAIRFDLTDRRGLRQEWESIDDEIREEIIETWRTLVTRVLERYLAGEATAPEGSTR